MISLSSSLLESDADDISKFLFASPQCSVGFNFSLVSLCSNVVFDTKGGMVGSFECFLGYS